MGWVGVGALIATACCLLCRCPPNTWAWAWTFGLWARVSRPESKPQSLPPVSAETEKDVKDEDELTSKTAAEPVFSPPQEEEENSDAGTAQSTPKATALATPPADIPTFNLEDGDAPAEKTSPAPSQTNEFVKPPLPTVSAAPEMSVPPSVPSTSTSSLMPPPPPPRLRATPQQQQQQQQQTLAPPRPNPAPGRFPAPPRPGSNATLRPPPSAASSLRVPQSSSGLSSSTLAPVARGAKPGTSSRRVILEPGHSPLDWAALTSDPNNKLRGADLPPTLIRVTPSMLKAHNGRKGRDAWTSYQGKVYNITPYLPFHPGGKGELLRGAGKDSGKLFLEIHPWVNWDGILGECLVGILVSENDAERNNAEGNSLDAMD